MIALKEGEKRNIRVEVRRLTGDGAIVLTAPQRRILNQYRAVVALYDWATATWTANDPEQKGELSVLFDSTVTALSAVGHYYVQLRGIIDAELYEFEIKVEVVDWGP